MTRRLVVLAVLALALAAPAAAQAAIDYPDFASTAGLQLNGDAKQEGNLLRLTPAEGGKGGAAYSTTPLNPQESFENSFAIHMHDSTCCSPGGILQPADGMAFVIQSQGLEAGEGLGGSLGYSGIKPSVVVEFDIYYNVFGGDPPTDHVAIMKDGDGGNHLACANAGPVDCATNLPFPLYGPPVYGWVEYNAPETRLKVWLSQSATKPAAPLLDHQISLAELGGSAFVGFTAATGSHNAVQDVLSWRQGGLGTLAPPAAATAPPSQTGPVTKPGKRCGKKKGKAKGKGKKKGAQASKKGKGKAKGKKPCKPKKKGKGKRK